MRRSGKARNKKEKTMWKRWQEHEVDDYLKCLPGKKVTFVLMSEKTLTGKVEGVGKDTLLLSDEETLILLFKHAIARIEVVESEDS